MKNVQDIYPLTPAQQGMLFHCLEVPDSGAYFEQYTCVLRGPLSADKFQDAWRQVSERHAALRTAFVWEGVDEPLQIVRQTAPAPWVLLDWSDAPADAPVDDLSQRLEAFMTEDRAKGFDLAKAPLLRFALIRTGRSEHRFVWSSHHLLWDGWSTARLVKEAFSRYDALTCGQPYLEDAPPPFRDYIAWLKGQAPASADAYWASTLGGFSTPTRLSLPAPRSAVEQTSARRERCEAIVPHETTQSLLSLAKKQRLTLNTIVQGAWALLLSHYSGQEDIVYGTTVAGRPAGLRGAESMIGMFINTLPVRVSVRPNESLIAWLHSMQNRLAEMRQFEHSSLADLPRFSDLTPGQPLFENILVFENYPLSGQTVDLTDGVTIHDIDYQEQSHYPLALLVVPGPMNTSQSDTEGHNGIQLILIYDPDRYHADAMQRMLEHLGVLFESIVSNPDRSLAQLPVLTPGEREQLLDRWNATDTVSPGGTTWLGLFDEQVRRTPGSVAVRCGDQTLTYEQLDAQSRGLAARLRETGTPPGSLVGISVERSVEMIVAIIGVLRSGAAYVPIDPSYPAQRIAYMIDDAAVPVLVTQRHLMDRMPANRAKHLILDDATAGDAGGPDDPSRNPSPSDPAYVIYTSGSTGTPRGVRVTHRNLLYSTAARFRYYDDPVERFLLLSSLSFDSSVAGVFWTLACGGELCIPQHDSHNDPDYLVDLIERERITHLLGVPSFYELILAEGGRRLHSLTTAIVAGEACPTALVRGHAQTLPGTALYNEYGPTEATVWATALRCDDLPDAQSVPIGRPIPNAKVYVLDRFMQPTPVGIAGEIYIGGKGITDGYLNRPELTAERFIANPLTGDPYDRLYRTGDRARHQADGHFEFLGRMDDQVKISGYRIELGEIENSLSEHPAIREAVVLAQHDRPTNDTSAGSAPYDTDALLTRLGSLTPEYAHSLVREVAAQPTPIGGDVIDIEETRRGPLAAQTTQDPYMNNTTSAVQRHFKKTSDVEITVDFLRDNYIAPPRPAQRQWLLDQAVNELSDNLAHLDAQAKHFVCGAPHELRGYDIHDSNLDDDHIMEDWQTPLMKAMADHVTESHGDILEIGFGRGVSASFIQDAGVRSHTIVEANPQCVRTHFDPWRQRYADRDIRLIEGKWQDTTDQFKQYDGIFFHAFPLDENEFVDYVVNSVTFAQHAFPMARRYLKPGGVFVYLTTEIDSVSRRHQRLLFEHFSSLTLSVQPVEVPEDTCDTWWAQSMVVIKATK